MILLAGFPTARSIESPALEALLPRLAVTNLFLALFNLLPAFPMDGGRALRAMLSMRMGRVSATRLASRLGHIIAGLFVLLGLISANPILLLIGIFIYFGASAEAADTELRQLAQTLTVADAMRSNVRLIASSASISDAINLMLQAGQHAIPVISSDGTLKGIATKDGIIRAIHRSGRAAPVDEALEPNVLSVASHRKLADALDQMQSQSAPAIVVVDREGGIVGLLTSDTLADLMVMKAAPEKPDSKAQSANAPLIVSVPNSAYLLAARNSIGMRASASNMRHSRRIGCHPGSRPSRQSADPRSGTIRAEWAAFEGSGSRIAPQMNKKAIPIASDWRPSRINKRSFRPSSSRRYTK